MGREIPTYLFISTPSVALSCLSNNNDHKPIHRYTTIIEKRGRIIMFMYIYNQCKLNFYKHGASSSLNSVSTPTVAYQRGTSAQV